MQPRSDETRDVRWSRTLDAMLRLARRWVLGALVLAIVFLVLWLNVHSQWAQVRRVIGGLSLPALSSSLAFALAGTWFSFLSWRALLADFGSRIPLRAAMRIFFLGQLGKYVPGKFWQVVAQVRLGRDHKVPGRASAAAATIVTLITLGAGLLSTVLTLPALGGDALHRYWWALLVLPAAFVLLAPPVLNRLLGRLMLTLRRDPMPQPLSLPGIGRAVGWALVMWLCYGLHLWVLLGNRDVLDPGLLLRSVGAFAGSWAIGFLLVLAPAGIGARELSLATMLGAAVAGPVAIAAALVSRLILTAVDVIWPVLAVALDRRARRAGPTPVDLAPDPTSAELIPAERASVR